MHGCVGRLFDESGARWSALESSWVKAKDVMPCKAVAASTPTINQVSRSERCLLITSSTSTFGDHGRTSPATRLITIRKNPPTSRPTRGRTSAHTSGHAALSRSKNFFFFIGSVNLSLDAKEVWPPHGDGFLQIVLRKLFIKGTSYERWKLRVRSEA